MSLELRVVGRVSTRLGLLVSATSGRVAAAVPPLFAPSLGAILDVACWMLMAQAAIEIPGTLSVK